MSSSLSRSGSFLSYPELLCNVPSRVLPTAGFSHGITVEKSSQRPLASVGARRGLRGASGPDTFTCTSALFPGEAEAPERQGRTGGPSRSPRPGCCLRGVPGCGGAGLGGQDSPGDPGAEGAARYWGSTWRQPEWPHHGRRRFARGQLSLQPQLQRAGDALPGPRPGS